MSRHIYTILTAIIFCAAVQSAAQDSTYTDHLAQIRANQVGIYIEDLRSGEVVLDVNGEVPMVPASITKAVTVSTLFNTVSHDSTLDTEFLIDGKITNDGTLDGNILIKTSGDPTIESAHFSKHQGVADSVATAITAAGIRKVSGRIIAVYPSVMEEAVPDGWMDEDLVWPYGTAHHAVNYADNTIELIMPGKKTIPEVPKIDIAIKKSRRTPNYSRKRNSSTITLSSRIAKKSRNTLSNPNPEATLCHAIKNALKKAGVDVEDRRIKRFKAKGKPIYTHHSPTFYDIARSLMFRSDNLMAEGMLRATSPGKSRKEALNNELRFWADNGVDTCGIVIEDGSGLSRNNRITPYFMADVLVWMLQHKNVDNEFVDLFPVAGESGTMKSFLSTTPLCGLVAAKTGSMRNVQCYAGFKIDESRTPTHVIVVMINDFCESRAILKKAIEDILTEKLL